MPKTHLLWNSSILVMLKPFSQQYFFVKYSGYHNKSNVHHSSFWLEVLLVFLELRNSKHYYTKSNVFLKIVFLKLFSRAEPISSLSQRQVQRQVFLCCSKILALAPIWLPHWPACKWTISLMLLISCLLKSLKRKERRWRHFHTSASYKYS